MMFKMQLKLVTLHAVIKQPVVKSVRYILASIGNRNYNWAVHIRLLSFGPGLHKLLR